MQISKYLVHQTSWNYQLGMVTGAFIIPKTPEQELVLHNQLIPQSQKALVVTCFTLGCFVTRSVVFLYGTEDGSDDGVIELCLV